MSNVTVTLWGKETMVRFSYMFFVLMSVLMTVQGCDSDDARSPLLLSGDASSGDTGEQTDGGNNGQACFTDDECPDGEACFADDPSVSAAGGCRPLSEEGGACRFGTQCGNGLFCAIDQSTGDGVCEPFPSDCPTPPNCDCALAVCARLGGSSCSVGVLDDPASSITVSCAGGVGPAEAMDAGVDAMIEDEIEPIALPFVVDDHFTERAPWQMQGTVGLLHESRCQIRPNTVGACHRFTWRWRPAWDSGENGYYWSLAGGPSGELVAADVAPGARRVRFSAYGSNRPKVQFIVLYRDTAGELVPVGTDLIEVTGSPTEHVIDLSDLDYEHFYTGFSWMGSIETQRSDRLSLYIDNIRWE